jgi:hypothetical protein
MVFWASTATLVTTAGIVPLQAGIFAIEDITETSQKQFLVSQQFQPASSRTAAAIVSSAQSVYGILNLNETMPAFMTRNYSLAPFTVPNEPATGGTWITNTTLYGMDLNCTSVPSTSFRISEYREDAWYNITNDCKLWFTFHNSDVVGEKIEEDGEGSSRLNSIRFKTFTSFFSGKHTYNGWPQSSNCTMDSSFFAMLVRNKLQSQEPGNKVTAIACTPSYYQRSAEVSVDADTKMPIKATSLGPKAPLAEQMFDSSLFEYTLTAGFTTGLADGAGSRSKFDRSDSLPAKYIPQYSAELRNIDLTPVENWSELKNIVHPMTAMALTTENRSLEDFLDTETLSEAYQAAYRLHFARAIADILQTNFSSTNIKTDGIQTRQVQAVTLVRVLTYILEALFALISLFMGALLFPAFHRTKHGALTDDPGMFHS